MRRKTYPDSKNRFKIRARQRLILFFFLLGPPFIYGKSDLQKSNDQDKSLLCPISCTCTELKLKSLGGVSEQDLSLDDEPGISFNSKFKEKTLISNSGIKIMCQKNALLESVKSLKLPGPIIENALQMDLSGNSLTKLTLEDFYSLSYASLQKLILKNNQIVHIDLDTFANLKNLKYLDVSYNQLTTFSSEIIEPLENLERLKISGNPLICDCNLSSLLIRATVRNIKLQGTCSEPVRLKDRSLNRLAPEELTCPSEDPFSIELKPNTNQIVFEGDPLRLSCKFKVGRIVSPIWTHTNSNNQTAIVSARGAAEIITSSRGTEHGTVTETQLIIRHLLQQHGGIWMCAWGGRSAFVEVTVLSLTTPTCPTQVTTSNKGRYNWPRTMANLKIVLPCQANSNLQAYRLCGPSGNWEEPDVSSCFYVNEVTKVLEQFSKNNFTLKTGALESARRLKSYLTELQNLTDPHEAIFITQALKNYVVTNGKYPELLPLVMDVYTILTKQPPEILVDVRQDLLELLQQYPLRTTKFNYESSSLSIAKNILTGKTPLAGTCVWRYVSEADKAKPITEIEFHSHYQVGCGLNSSGPGEVEAYIQIPLASGRSISDQTVILSLIMNTNMFINQKSKPLSSSVLGVTSNQIGTNWTNPITFTVRLNREIHDSDHVVGARWNHHTDQWSSEQCHNIKIEKSAQAYNTLTFQCCCELGYFAAIFTTDHTNKKMDERIGSKTEDASVRLVPYRQLVLHFLPSPVYVGSVIGMLCHVTALLCYIVHRRRLQITSSTWHALVNTWASVGLLMLIFTFGIRPLFGKLPCQVTGLLLHYLTLSSLLWSVVNASNLYKHLTKNSRTECEPDSSQTEEALPPAHGSHAKPALRYYLVGWGVPLIVVGIACAIHLEQYHNLTFCFLAWTPSLGAVGLPSAILVLLILTFCFLSWCYLRHTDHMIALHQRQLAAQQIPCLEQVPTVLTLEQSKETNLSEKVSTERKSSNHLSGYLPLTGDGDATSCPSNMTTQVTETSDLASLSSDHERLALLVRRGEAEGAISANESGALNSGRSESERPLLITSSSVASSSEDRIEDVDRTDLDEHGHCNPLMASFTDEADCKKQGISVSNMVPLTNETTQISGLLASVPAFTPPLVDDSDEKSTRTQLRGQLMFLVLFCLTWLSGLSLIARPFRGVLPHYDEMLSSLGYAFFSAATGLFAVIFHLLMRKDVCISCFDSPTKDEPEQPVSSLSGITAGQEAPLSNQLAHQHPQANISTMPYGTLSRRSEAIINIAVDEANRVAALNDVPIVELSNFDDLNVVVLDPALVVNSFYDARQSKIAKRFFQKQKLLQMQNNQLDRHHPNHHSHQSYHHNHHHQRYLRHSSRHSVNNAVSSLRSHSSHSPVAEEALLGAGASSKAKVNNVNIHVEIGAYDLHELQSRMTDRSWAKTGKQLLNPSRIDHRSDSFSRVNSRNEEHAITKSSLGSIPGEGEPTHQGAVLRSGKSDRAKRKRHAVNHQRVPKRSRWEGNNFSRISTNERNTCGERITYTHIDNHLNEKASTNRESDEDEHMKTLMSNRGNFIDESCDDESFLKKETSV